MQSRNWLYVFGAILLFVVFLISLPLIQPSSELYPAKKVWEKVYYNSLFSDTLRVDYAQNLLADRFAYLKEVAENRQLSEIEDASSRFSYQAGTTIEQLKKLNDQNEIKKTLGQFQAYKTVLANLRDLYTSNSAYWLLIQQNIDTLNILTGKITS